MNKSNNSMPLFTVFKREGMNKYVAIAIRVGVVILSIIISLLFANLFIKDNIFNITKTLFNGATILPWRLILDTFILLGFGISIVPAFKMKYWNMGANGQVLIGGLAAMIIMYKSNDFASKSSFNNFLIIMLMLISAILASVIWAIIPAIFKVLFKTNETLFTLMMNYIAAGLVTYVNYLLTHGKKESPGVINATTNSGWLPNVINKYFLPVLIILMLAAAIYFYISFTKHGYEITVLGDSYNTAKYVGMKTSFIVIRTLIVSGIITGILGFLYISAIDHSLSNTTGGSLGFTGVLIAWLSNFNPFIMLVISFMLSFLTLGTSKITSSYRLGSNNLSNIIISIIFFSILISEFFIRYKLKANFDYKKTIKNIKEFFLKIILKIKALFNKKKEEN